MTILKEETVRRFIKSLLEDKTLGSSLISVNPVVDPSAAITDPTNSNYKPHSKVELYVALTALFNDLPDEKAAGVYDVLKAALKTKEEEGNDQMQKSNKQHVEESIRLLIRKILNEVEVKKIPAGVHGAEYLSRRNSSIKSLQGSFKNMKDDSDSEELKRSDSPAAGRSRKNKMGDSDGLKKIADELGFKNPNGALQFLNRTLEKMKVRIENYDDVMVLSLQAMNDYILELSSAGQFTPADIQLLKDNPEIVADLDSFRVYLNKALKKSNI